MNDVEIIFPNAKEALAERLREAIARAGYAVAPGGGVAPEEAPAPGDARAILFLWDRSSIKQPGLQQAAAAVRNRGRAVDVSADGITPLDLTDENRLIQLSAWRGEPTHPGWRKIVAELERLCGGHRSAAAAGIPTPPLAPRASRIAPARDAEGPAPAGGKAKLAAICVAILLGLVLVGYVALSRRSVAVEGSPAPKQAIAAAQPMATPTSGTASPAQPQASQPLAAVSTAGLAQGGAGTLREVPAGPTAAAAPASIPAGQVQPPLPASGQSVSNPGMQQTRARPARQALRGVVRYTKYARTMRLFCQRSGRHTPECRMFNAAQRD